MFNSHMSFKIVSSAGLVLAVKAVMFFRFSTVSALMTCKRMQIFENFEAHFTLNKVSCNMSLLKFRTKMAN